MYVLQLIVFIRLLVVIVLMPRIQIHIHVRVRIVSTGTRVPTASFNWPFQSVHLERRWRLIERIPLPGRRYKRLGWLWLHI
jgi:hypothetical protein